MSDEVLSPILMDRSEPVGNTPDRFNRRAHHVKIGNTLGEQIPTLDAIANEARSGTIALSVTAVEVKVNASRLSSRKVLFLEAGANTILWGFSASTCVFTLFQNQTLILSVGDVPVYAKVAAGTAVVSVGEGD